VLQLSFRNPLLQELLLSGTHYQIPSPRWLRYHPSEAICLLHHARRCAHSIAEISIRRLAIIVQIQIPEEGCTTSKYNPLFLACTTCSAKHKTSVSSRWYWATSIASFRERLLDFMSCWIVLIHVVRGILWSPQVPSSPKGEAVKIFLASVLSGIRAMWPLNREKCRAWTIADRYSCLVVRLTSFRTWWYQVSQTPLIKSINLVCISLGNCPALSRTERLVEC